MGQTPPTDRYHRQTLLPGIGAHGQARLLEGHAMLVGCGALGCVIADLLARAGVGRLTIIDRDVVELTNLQRQTLFDERDARESTPKAEAARRRLSAVNSSITIHAVIEDFSSDNAEQLIRPHPIPGVLVDGTDNFETRYLINDAAVKLSIPYVYGGAVGTSGMHMTVIPAPLPGATPCLRCLFPDPPTPGSAPTCDTAGVLGPVTASVAAAQAAAAIKVLLGRTDTLAHTLESFDLWTNHRRAIDLAGARRSDCICCGERRFEFLSGDVAGATTVLCGRNSVQVTPARQRPHRGAAKTMLDLAEIAARLSRHGEVTLGSHTLKAHLGDGVAFTLFADGRAIVEGTTDPASARSIYAKYLGA